MEREVINCVLVGIIGEYGIVKTKEKIRFNNGVMFQYKTFYDVCLEQGDGDIVASFDKLSAAKKWASKN